VKHYKIQPIRRIGRPTVPAKAGEKATLTLRVTADIKTRLETAAVQSGRSLSAEAEQRLERSFEHDDIVGRIDTLRAELKEQWTRVTGWDDLKGRWKPRAR
jgi:hypothetical protein